MSLMKQFARNKRSKENTIVVTARLPESLYDKFQQYCGEYGFSLSEAINLLINNEVNSIESEEKPNKNDVKKNDDEIKTNTGEYKKNTNSGETNKPKIQANRKTGEMNTGRFTTAPFRINDELPCPLCGKWENRSNYARHAKKHNSTTEKLLTEHSEKVQAMIESRKDELEAKQEERENG